MVGYVNPLPNRKSKTSTTPEREPKGSRGPLKRAAAPPAKDAGSTNSAGVNPWLSPMQGSIRVLRRTVELLGVKLPEDEWSVYERRLEQRLTGFVSLQVPWYKVMKYKLAAFAAYWLGQEEYNNLPSRPDSVPHTDLPGVLFGGKVHRWMRMKMRSRQFRFRATQTILQSKMGMPRPDMYQAAAAGLQTAKSLTESLEIPTENFPLYRWSDFGTEVKQMHLPMEDDYFDLNAETVKRQIQRTVRELFEGKAYDMYTMSVPSTSSSYESRIVDGGNFLEVADWYRQRNSLTDLYNGPSSLGLKIVIDPDDITTGRASYSPPVPRAKQLLFDLDRVKAESKLYRDAIRKEAMSLSEVHTNIVALSESLKIRPITQGSSIQQTALDSFQKSMHGILREHPAFALIGRSVDADYVAERLGRRPLAPDEFWLSGDYSAATDGIVSVMSELVINTMADIHYIDDVTAALALSNLVDNYIVLGKGSSKPIFEGYQAKGQLMGSITSFPVLCIINAALVRWTLEIMYKRVFSLEQAPMMINGDDNLWRARWVTGTTREMNMSPMTFFEKVAQYFSFKLSIGKTYLSKDIAVINSVMFQTRTVTQQGGWRRLDWAHVPFYSMSPFGGGQRRSGTPIDWPQEIYKAFMNKRFSSADIKDVLYKIITSDDPEDQRLQLDANLGGVLYIQEILAHMDGPRLTEEDIKSLMSDYVDAPELESQRVFGTRRYGDVAIGTYVRDCLKQAPAGFSRLNYYRLILRDLKPLLKDAGVPWFIPESLGGLGFPCMDCNGELTTVGELAFGPSQLDLMVADQVFNLMTLGKGPRAVRQETPWELHKVVMDKVPRKYVRLVNKNDYEPEEVDLLMKNHQKLYSALVFDAFLHEPTDRLFSSEQSFQSLKSVQHNQEIWRASSYTNLSKRRMRTAEELWHNDGLVEIISARETTSEDKREIRRFLLRLQLGTDYVGTGQVTRDPGWVPIASQEVPASASAVNRLDYPDELEVQGTEYIPSGNDNGIYTFVSPDFRKLVADRDYSYEPDQYTPLYPHYNSDSESDDDEDDAFSVLEIDIARMRQRNWSIDSSIPPGSPAGL